MMAGYPVRVRIGVLSVIVFALLSSGLHRTLDPPPWAITQDEISRYEARFWLLRSALPPEGVVGYLSEPWRPSHDLDWLKGFFLTQYALTPLVVVDSIAPALVIGKFRSAGPARNPPDPTLVLVRDFGDGVLLFRHQPR